MDRGAVRGHRATDAPNNLPHHLTSFVGREAELRSLKGLFSTARMITLIGTGGSGKSRLAAEIAKASVSLWPDGVWWIELAAATDVSGAVVATLELPGRGSAQDVASSWLAKRRALLILDNCEHLVAECAAFSQTALERCLAEGGALGHQVLGVVQEQERSSFGQPRRGDVLGRPPTRQLERGNDRAGHVRRRGQLDPPHAVGPQADAGLCDLGGQPALAGAARAGERDHPRRAEKALERAKLSLASNEAGQVVRQIVRGIGRAVTPDSPSVHRRILAHLGNTCSLWQPCTNRREGSGGIPLSTSRPRGTGGRNASQR